MSNPVSRVLQPGICLYPTLVIILFPAIPRFETRTWSTNARSCGWDEILYLPEHSTSSPHPLKPVLGLKIGHGLPSSLLVGPASKRQIRGWEWTWQGGKNTRHTEERWRGGERQGSSGPGTQGLRKYPLPKGETYLSLYME